MKVLNKVSLVASIALVALGACGRDETQGARERTVSESGKPAKPERAPKAFDDRASELPEAEGSLNVMGSSDSDRYTSYKAGFESLWKSVAVRPEHSQTVDWYVNQVVANKARYQKIQDTTGVPWFWVGITHGLEGDFNFASHLHNGDSLHARTYHVPAGRPLSGTAPFSWELSAVDALSMKGYDKNWGDWSLPSILAYSWERYNGFGYRSKGINSPYLWSYSYHYSAGKYTDDGYYDPNAVSGQAGAMSILKRGLDRGLFTLFVAPPVPATVKADAKPMLSRALQIGVADGADVLLLKMRMKSFGFFAGTLDQRFDASADAGVRAAQKAHGLGVDGAVGPLTWSKLWPSVSDAGWMKAWGSAAGVDVRAMAGERCLFKVVAKEVSALAPFLRATSNARTISFGGETGKAALPNECPDIREVYDLAGARIIPPAAAAPTTAAPATSVTWHKLFRGPNDEWHLSSMNGGNFVTSLRTRVKDDLVTYLERHTGARNVLPATNEESVHQ